MAKRFSLKLLTAVIIAVMFMMNIGSQIRPVVRADSEGITRFVMSLYSSMRTVRARSSGLKVPKVRRSS